MHVFMYAWIWVLWRALTGTSQKLCALGCLRDWNRCILTNERFSDIWSEACDRWKRSDDSDNDCDFCMINRSINRSIYRSTDQYIDQCIYQFIHWFRISIQSLTKPERPCHSFLPSNYIEMQQLRETRAVGPTWAAVCRPFSYWKRWWLFVGRRLRSKRWTAVTALFVSRPFYNFRQLHKSTKLRF